MRGDFLEVFLQACRRHQSLERIKSLHVLSITTGLQLHHQIFISNNFIAAYGFLGELPIAQKVFDKMPERTSVSYNSIISACVRHEHEAGAWKLFKQMMGSGFRPTQFTFGSLLSSSKSDSFVGFQLHTLILKSGLLHKDAFSGTALLGLFGRLGMMDEAMRLFEEMPKRSLVTWNSIISSFGRLGFVEETMVMFCELLRTENQPSESSFVGVLSGFGGLSELELGEQIHGMVIKTGSEFYLSVSNCLVSMYLKCSGPYLAEEVFRKMPFRDIVTWNIVIGAFAKSESPEKALELFLIVPWYGFMPTQATFASVISSCVSLQILKYGELIHAKTIKNGFQYDVFVGSALVDFYAKSNEMEQAHLLFNELDEKNAASWNALIAVYANKNSQSAVHLLQEMICAGYQPNEFSFSAVFKSSSIQELQQLHCLILRLGYDQNDYVCNSLIASYAVNGLISEALTFASALSPPLSTVSSNIIAGIYKRSGQWDIAENLLFQLENHDIISKNILISTWSHGGDHIRALQLFRDMLMHQILPDKYLVTSILNISIKLRSLALGSSIHGLMIKLDSKCCDLHMCNVLMDMYAKCGNLKSSLDAFNEMTEKNLISWTVLISALGFHGYACLALERFREMEFLGFKPDRVAFITVLSACRHGGLVEEGIELFRKMKEYYGVEPDMDHYVCMVDLLARYGHLKEAEQLINNMPFQPNALIWRSYLEGCKMLDNGEKQVVG